MHCEKIYATGNHDNEINEVEGLFPRKPPPEITIVRHHYPSGTTINGKETFPGMRIGKHRYHFLHGQQFDILFFLASVLRDYPGWVSNNSEVFREHPGIKLTFRGILLITTLFILADFFGLYLLGFWGFLIHVLFGISLVVTIFSLNTGTFRSLWDLAAQKTHARGQTFHQFRFMGL